MWPFIIRRIYLFILLFYFVYFGVCQTYDPRPTVHLQQGTIVGVKVYPDVSRVAVNAFLGIPYAQPPEGHLRFAIPQRHRGWNGTLYASNYGPVCPFRATSMGVDEKEDCLYLNIWTPEDAYSHNKLPVIIYLETEQLLRNQPNLIRIPGHDLATEGAVVVSVSYRQNIFGFFCLGTPEARGNLGLLDQYLAFLWVKENIEQFGGNPQTITLLGHSSSAVTILYHMSSPRTTGLFSSVIIMSGSATAPWYTKDPILISNKLINDLSCSMPSTLASLDCLKTKSVQEILRHFDRQTEDDIWYKSVMPIVDTFLPEKERYLPVSLQTAFQSGNFTAVPLLTGITDFLSNAEQCNYYFYLKPGLPASGFWRECPDLETVISTLDTQSDLLGRWSDLNQDYSQLMQYAEESVIPTIIHQYGFDGPNKEDVKDIIRWKYLWSVEKDARVLAEKIHNLQWDARVAAPHDKQLSLLSNSSRMSIFNYVLHQFSTLANVSTTSTIGGDLLLLFGPVLLQQVARRRFNVAEDNLSKYLKQLWVAFARKGNPTLNGYQETWQVYTINNKYVQYFGNRQWNPAEFDNSINLWNKLLPKLVSVSNTVNSIPKELQFSPDPAAGFRHAMYTLVGLVVALLALLLVCVILLKKRAKERTRHMGF